MTVSYFKDVERFSLLRESIRRFHAGSARHVVIVPRQDLQLFQGVAHGDPLLEVLAQQDLVQPNFYPKSWYVFLETWLPSQRWRVKRAIKKYAGVSGWQLQQPIKLNIPRVVSDGVAVILDSDLVFLREFSDSDFGAGDPTKRLLLRIEQGLHPEQMKAAWTLLGRPVGPTGYHYTTMPMIMYPDWLTKLQLHLEKMYLKNWQQVLFEVGAIHEDCVYGIFVEEVLNPQNLVVSKFPLSYMVWDELSLRALQAGDWQALHEHRTVRPICVVVQSNLGVTVSDYRHAIESFWKRGVALS